MTDHEILTGRVNLMQLEANVAKLVTEVTKFQEETVKLRAEASKLGAEESKLKREAVLYPVAVAATFLIAWTGVIGLGLKFFGLLK